MFCLIPQSALVPSLLTTLSHSLRICQDVLFCKDIRYSTLDVLSGPTFRLCAVSSLPHHLTACAFVWTFYSEMIMEIYIGGFVWPHIVPWCRLFCTTPSHSLRICQDVLLRKDITYSTLEVLSVPTLCLGAVCSV